MNIWIDICHTPQYNFYRNLIETAAKNGHTVYLTVLDRGRTPKIIKTELAGKSNITIDVIGKHRMNKISAVWEANVVRIIQLLHWAKQRHIDLVFSNCMAAMIIGKLLGIPRYSFDDDPDTIDFYPKKWCSIESNYCLYDDPKTASKGGSVKVMKCLKEWSYLCPRVFKADEKALEPYGVTAKDYIFVREVSVGTVNYAGQQCGAVLDIVADIPIDKKVLLSLEEKDRRHLYPKDWILLQEPIQDIHSLIYYSLALVSSGDSMAREAAMLGVPAYYLGVRHYMPANKAAHTVAKLQNRQSMPFGEWINSLLRDRQQTELLQSETRERIDKEFIDINGYMLNIIDKVEAELKNN